MNTKNTNTGTSATKEISAKRNALNVTFSQLTLKQRIDLLKKVGGKGLTESKDVNEFFVKLSLKVATEVMAKITDKNVIKSNDTAKELSSNAFGLFKQLNIIKKELPLIVNEITNNKTQFGLIGFMSFSQFLQQCKTPGKYAVKFISEIETELKTVLPSSLSYNLCKEAQMMLILNKVDFDTTINKGLQLNEVLNGIRKGTNKISEAIEKYFLVFGIPKKLTTNELRYIYNNAFELYENKGLHKAYEQETEVFEFEAKYENLDETQIKTAKLELLKAGKVVSKETISRYYFESETKKATAPRLKKETTKKELINA